MKIKVMSNCKTELHRLFRLGVTSDDIRRGSKMYFALYAFENYGDATRDNNYEELVSLGKALVAEGGAS